MNKSDIECQTQVVMTQSNHLTKKKKSKKSDQLKSREFVSICQELEAIKMRTRPKSENVNGLEECSNPSLHEKKNETMRLSPVLRERMSAKDVEAVEQFTYQLLSDVTRVKLFRYLTHINENEVIPMKLKDSFGIEVDMSIKLPTYLTKPRDFRLDFYPLTADKSMFATARPYDYLCTFNIKSLERFDQEMIQIKAARALIAEQSQSRFTNIWRQIAAVLLALDNKIKRENNIIRRYLNAFLVRYDALPFFESREKMIFDNDDCVSILPSIIYMLISVGTDIVVGTMNEADAQIAIKLYISQMEGSYYDTKLKQKSAIRNWLKEGVNKLGTVEILKWSSDCQILGTYNRIVTEPEMVQQLIKENREERKQKLSSEFNKYIDDRLALIKNISDVETLFKLTRAMSNDKSYFKTLVELSLDAAVQPKIEERIVPAPFPLAFDNKDQMIDFTFRDVDPIFYMCERYLNDASEALKPVIGKLNYENEWLNYVTTSSAGKRMSDDELTQFPSIVRKLYNIRLVRVALESERHYSIMQPLESIEDSTVLVVRQQIDRRQRTIAGLTNAKLFASFPSYRIGKEYYNLSTSVAQGKQIGNMLDVSSMLYLTTLESALCSSVDISGMDASIQSTLRRVYDSLTFTLAANSEMANYGSFLSSLESVKLYNSSKGTYEEVRQRMSGVYKALVFQASTMQSSTIYNSNLFGVITNREGTFESGRADTSTHHTVLLDALLVAAGKLYCESGKPFTRIFKQEMGDDIICVYSGRMNFNVDNAKYDAEVLQKAGFKTTLDISRNQCIFLQQQIVLGKVYGLADRVSLFTREHVKAIKSLKSACAELNSLVDDMSSRITDPFGLRLLTWAIGLLCLSRHTLKLEDNSYDEVAKVLEKYIRIQKYDNAVKRSTRLLTIYMPFSWLWMYGGGELFFPSLQREDGTWTTADFITSPGGEYKRRKLIELIGVNNIASIGPVINNAIRAYSINKSQFLIDIDIDGLEEKSRIKEEEEISLMNLSDRLDSLGDTRRIDKSKRAFDSLSRQGHKLPRSVVYGYNNFTKIKQLITSGEKGDVSPTSLTENLLFRMRELLGVKYTRDYSFTLKDSDIYHLYEIVFTDVDVGLLPHAWDTDRCPFLFSMRNRNEVWLLHSLLGGPAYSEGSLRRELASIRGKYAQFKYSDPTFKEALKVFLNNKKLLPEFMDAVGVRSDSQGTYMKALEYYAQFGNYQYDYVINPRRLFYLSENVSITRETVLITDPNDDVEQLLGAGANLNLLQSLLMTYAFTYLLSSIEDFKNILSRFYIKLHPLLKLKLIR